MNWKNIFLGTAAAVFFSLLYVLGVFERPGNQVYDFYLGLRADRQRSSEIVFLDVDDNAIAYNGVFPWPRSVTADALLRLKEFGTRAAIFDIEYIEKGPQGVDSIYLKQGLSSDFDGSFSRIASDAQDLLNSIAQGWIARGDINEYAKTFIDSIHEERERLFSRARNIARDNDEYLIQASSLFGRSWTTLNLREQPLRDEEQASRRLIAEDNFSYPVDASQNANKGRFADILPALPGLSLSAAGAGFTNAEVDRDGIRRRVDLAQNVHDHWYLQLALSPLVSYLGNPVIELDSRRMTIKNARLPQGQKDIKIPLDGEGRMLLDWPKKDYFESYTHISFYDFSLLEDIEAELEQYSRDLEGVDFYFFSQFDPSLQRLPIITIELSQLFDSIHAYRGASLADRSEEYFNTFVEYRAHTRYLINEILKIDPAASLNEMLPELTKEMPYNAEVIYDATMLVTNRVEALKINLERYEELHKSIGNAVRDKFCILGRADTGTADTGSNPFYGKYINAGTHGVVFDMILSQVFISAVGMPLHILFSVFLVFVFLVLSAKFSPAARAASGFIVTVLVVAVTGFLFHYTGIFFNPLLAVFSMTGAVILREIISYAVSEKEKQFIRKAFSTYVSHDVVKEIIADPSRLQLGGTKRHMSAIFTDVKGFSTISEQLEPESLVSLLNRYLTCMSDVILEQKGTIDKYEGDAIIAFFGAPVESEDHALRACTSALLMKKIEAELNKKITEEKLTPLPLLTRVGINTGDMVAGNMGTGNKMNYTIMGNAVNLAARLEGVNKQYGTWLLASESTIKETKDKILTRRLDRVRVVGINEPVRLHELVETAEAAADQQKKLVSVFHQALDLFEKRRWKEAMQGFTETMSIEKGGPSEKYLNRCREFLKTPPNDGWDGVYNLTEK
jgi:adenylate cyclase